MSDHNIVIKNLCKNYGSKRALLNIDLTIGQGMFGLLGRNGAGKTTLMKTIATLHSKQCGSVEVCGIPVENSSEVRKIIGYLPQEFSLYPSMTVTESLDYLGVLSGMTRAQRRKRIPLLLKKVNLQEHKFKKVRALSGGMKRRLGIAQALLHDPKVLIVDEPTAGLDPEERIRFRNLLCEVAEERIVILSTHIVGDIEATCEDIAILEGGKILYKGTVENLLEQAEGKVYTMQVTKQILPQIKKQYLVTGMHTQGKKSTVRFISDIRPDVEARLCEPNVEDAYMYCLHRSGIRMYNMEVNGNDILSEGM